MISTSKPTSTESTLARLNLWRELIAELRDCSASLDRLSSPSTSRQSEPSLQESRAEQSPLKQSLLCLLETQAAG